MPAVVETPEGDLVEAAILRQIALAVADAAAAAGAAVCCRRSRDRARLPARHAPAGASRPLRAVGTAARAAPAQLRSARQLDRRRSRRQSQRHRRLAAADAAARVADGHRQLSGAGARARRGSVDFDRTGAPTEAVAALAEHSGDSHAARRDEPYRRAITGIYARLAANLRAGRRPRAAAAAVDRGEPYETADELRADLVAIATRSLERCGGLLATGGALGRLIRAVETCGFHLATLDLRQNADVHAASSRNC